MRRRSVLQIGEKQEYFHMGVAAMCPEPASPAEHFEGKT